MKLFVHYAVYDNSVFDPDHKPYHINDFVSFGHGNVIEKKSSFWYGSMHLVNKKDFKRLLIENKACARIKIQFQYWDDHELTEKEYVEMIRKYLLDEVERTLRQFYVDLLSCVVYNIDIRSEEHKMLDHEIKRALRDASEKLNMIKESEYARTHEKMMYDICEALCRIDCALDDLKRGK